LDVIVSVSGYDYRLGSRLGAVLESPGVRKA